MALKERGWFRISCQKVARLRDICAGHSCYPPRANCEASSNVIVNGRGWHRQGDGWETFPS